MGTKLSMDVTIPKASPTILSSTTRGTAGHSTEAYPVYARPYHKEMDGQVGKVRVG
jgi:hypothetical protein